MKSYFPEGSVSNLLLRVAKVFLTKRKNAEVSKEDYLGSDEMATLAESKKPLENERAEEKRTDCLEIN